MRHITLFGLAGTGTSTIGKALAQDLGYEFFSSGGILRSLAAQKGIPFIDFVAMCSQDPIYDREVDFKLQSIGESQHNAIVEGRLAFHFISHSYKIKCVCEYHERIARVAVRDNVTLEQAYKDAETREQSDPKRYKEYYNIDNFGDDSHFDLIVDTSGKTVQESVEYIRSYL